LYKEQLFYENFEKELFDPPVRQFVSTLEIVMNIKQEKEEEKQVNGRVAVDVLFDRETKKEKVKTFKDNCQEIFYGKGWKQGS